MRKLLIAVVLIVLLVVVGWVTFRYDGRQASVNFNTDKARQDTQQVIEKGEAAVEQATARGKELIDDTSDRQ
ncbi:MAG: hypothetical protein JNG89_21260 [Planctomycetaceae bacterium]|nr:hypothetical protein [Planctomycetaceae bacterium]